ncbi:hypothetical protein OJ997_05500 [Solirubrobacter phytolaccae]|uniref:Uncharacterized protein n=1 Tax=Solirubrobacter phytolaccae TaxID=1404360 RepID=A0A9X3N7G0_9ACTN|nr:hypothetical protein [Solirubrobacter phytolaccae]MDA0179739.1 hypothetical protein [Solirubrobacter phytolaccae]
MSALSNNLRALHTPPAAQPVNGNQPSYAPEFDDKGRMALAPLPGHDNTAGLCAWLTASLALDRSHPITGGRREGVRGPAGHVVLERRGTDPFRFEPAARINTPARLVEDLSWQALPTDSAIPPFKSEHARQIAHAIRMLCGTTEALTDAEETASLVAAFISGAVLVEGMTIYGTAAQRYEATAALQRDMDPVTGFVTGAPRFLLDAETGEYVIRVSDLHEAGRRFIGGSLARGWVDARMQNLGWTRARLQGYALTGREGRRNGPHTRVDVYRGHLPNDEPVNT